MSDFRDVERFIAEAIEDARDSALDADRLEESPNAGSLVPVFDFSLDAKTNQSLGEDGRMVRSRWKNCVC